MTITKTVLNIDEPAVASNDLVWHHADRSLFTEVDTVTIADGSRETLYQKVAGNDEYPMTVRVGSYPATGKKVSSNTSVRVNTFLETVDSDAGTTVYGPVSAVLAITVPGTHLVPNVDDVKALIQNLVSWLLPLEAGNFGDDALQQLRFGATNGVRLIDDPTA